MIEYSGEERRKMHNDHDLLIKIDANLGNLIKSVNDHVNQDTVNFKKLDDKIAILNKGLWVSIGGAAVIIFIIKYVV